MNENLTNIGMHEEEPFPARGEIVVGEETESNAFGEENYAQSSEFQNNQPLIELAKADIGITEKRRDGVQKENIKNETEGWLTVDVYETPSDIVVESAVAGINPNDLDITATPDSVTIKGERKRNKEIREGDYLYQECYWGKFSRSVLLPQEIDPEAAAVNFKDGILTVRLPKINKKKATKLRVGEN